jgi:hypothetical protein
MEQENVVILKKPILAHGEELKELVFREPTGKDIRKNGWPYTMSSDGNVILSGPGVAAYIQDLAGVNPAAVDSMHPVDVNAAGWKIAGFFLAD